MKYTHVIWDFNGTILDDVNVGIESVNVLLKRRGLPCVKSVEHYHSVFGFPIKEYYKKLGFDLLKEDYEKTIAPEWVNEYLSRVQGARLNKNVIEVLKEIKASKLKQIIVSATELNMLRKQLKMLGVENYFDEIYGLSDIYADSKSSLAIEWRRKNPNANAVFVGDTDHDFFTANSICADCVLYSGGHQSRESLLKLSRNVIDDFLLLKKLLY